MAQFASAVTNYVSALTNATFPAIRRNKITDQVFDSSPFLALMRATKHLEFVKGGLYHAEVANVGKSPNAGWYVGQGQGFKLQTFEGLIQLGWDWKFAHDAVVVTGPELVMNEDSDDAIVDLVQARVDISSLTLPDIVATDFYLNNIYGTNIDGSTGNPASIESASIAVDDGTVSGTVAQQSRTTYPTLKGKVNYNSAIGAGMITALQASWLSANRGSRSRTKAQFTNELCYGSYWGQLQTPERYIIDPMRLEAIGLKTTGGNDIGFNDCVVLLDEKCPTAIQKPVSNGGSGGMWYGLNTDFWQLKAHPNRFFTLGEWKEDPYADQYYLNIWLAIALECTRPNRQFAIWFSGG